MAEIDISALHLADTISKNPKFQGLLRSLNPRGHQLVKIQGELPKDFLLLMTFSMMKSNTEKLMSFSQALESGVPLSEPIPVGNLDGCSACSESVNLESDGVMVQAEVECSCPQGPIVVLLNVPSGEMIYSDRLEKLFPLPSLNINYRIGIVKTAHIMQHAGCAVGFVGDNRCVVAAHDEKVFKIVTLPDNDENDHLPDQTFGDEDSPFYMFVDADEYKRRGGKDDANVWRLKVRPGVYRFSHTLPDRYNLVQPYEFATVVWVREPDPARIL